MSHNIYNVDNDSTSNKLCNYLIKIEQSEDFEEIIPCNNITTAIKIASEERTMCRLYERAGTMGKNWIYLCDISRGVI